MLLAAAALIVLTGCGTASAEPPSAGTVYTQSAAAEKENQDKGNLRNTIYGPVSGKTENGVSIWYGIPYGKEPSGDLRWKAPLEPEPWTQNYDASEPKEPAIQLLDNGVIGTEDCLNLDIYSGTRADKRPVMVFLHGGNNQTGNTQELPGTDLVQNNDIVFVSVNYRLGLLGFNCLPSLVTGEEESGNYALLDIAMALDWIKDNIEEFGGDPNNITVSGFSAGGRDVMTMLISPLFDGKFQKAIAFSGGMTTADEELSAARIARAIAPLAVKDGMLRDETQAESWLLGTGDEVRKYLYSISSDRLAALMGNAGIRMSEFPHLYADGVTLPREGFDTENYHQVPLLMLTGTTEFSMFAEGDAYFSDGEMAGLSGEGLEAAKAFAIRYGSHMYEYFNTEASAERMHPHYGAPIYLCSVNYGDTSSQYQIPVYGAFHGIFVPMLSSENNYASVMPGIFDTPAYEDMAGQFNRYLKNFLYYGDPNGEGLETWEAWNPEKRQTMVFDGADGRGTAQCRESAAGYETVMDEMDRDQTVPLTVKEQVIRHVMNGRWFSEALDKRYDTKKLWK